jgi:hypothetical protein
VPCVKYLSYGITYENEKDITETVPNYSRAVGVVGKVFKPSLVEKCKKLKFTGL